MTTPSEDELKSMIIEVLNLEEVTAGDISADEDLFGSEGLALDSIDALEIGVAIQKRYGIKIDSEDKSVAAHFKSIRTLAAFIAERQQR